ncbi:hypothetical protein Pecwa_0192 [Pectobacterium parmentieri WPP163]|nr:hypothetical protein Pecwa_0192 [Pectobacterium parmentieri WPP163]
MRFLFVCFYCNGLNNFSITSLTTLSKLLLTILPCFLCRYFTLFIDWPACRIPQTPSRLFV